MTPFHAVARADDVPQGKGRIIEAQGRRIALFHTVGGWFALDNTCLHQGGPLAEGAVEGGAVTCPWHGWRYDLATGKSLTNPVRGVRRYEVRVEGGVVQVAV